MKLNTAEVAKLQPDYLGFIFYEKSPRYCSDNKNLDKEISLLHNTIGKVGVFVNASPEAILEKIRRYKLDVIQLHGSESPDYVKNLRKICTAERSRSPIEIRRAEPVEVWKVFSIKDTFDFSVLKEYEPYVDKFLFDTKGKEKGGNGYTFDWSILTEYPSQKPFILSGGIGIDEINQIKRMQKTGLPLYAIDVNSKFESEPGLKDVELLGKFKEELGI